MNLADAKKLFAFFSVLRNSSKFSFSQVRILNCEIGRCEEKIGFFEFFLPLLNLSENWSLVTCIANLGRINEKLFKSLRRAHK